MFLKSTTSKGNTYLQIVQSYRENNEIKHKVIANLGRLDTLLANGLENIVKSLNKYLPNKENPNKLDITTLEEKARVNYGYIVYKTLWEKYSITELLKSLIINKRIKYELIEIVFSLVINRLLEPSSKLYHYNHRQHYLATDDESKLHDIYRSLKVLSDNKEEIQKDIFEKNKNLFNMKVDIVLYDVTTFHYESQKVDELRNYGFSKANKINEVQVVMGLLVDTEGRPIGYELFSGNTFDGKTMIKVLQKLKEKYELNQIIIVADKGLNSKINLKEIKDAGFDYIVSARIKNMTKKVQEEIISENDYEKIETGKEEEVYKYKVIGHEYKFNYEEKDKDERIIAREKISLTEKLVCTYSSLRARKDQNDRLRGIEKAQKIIECQDVSYLNKKKGFKRYIKEEGKEEKKKILKLDMGKIKNEERFDGYYAIQYSKIDMSPLEVINKYHSLYKVEESFRILKTTMETRPIYLRNKEHIEGHFVICFIAFLLERELELRLKNQEIEYSAEKIKEALNSLEFSKIEIENQIFYMKSKCQSLASKIMECLRIKKPSNLLSESQMIDYMNS